MTDLAVCPQCHLQSMIKLDDDNTRGCIYCDLPFEGNIYKNVCWNCRNEIDSRLNQRSSVSNMGYKCNRCGEDLQKIKAA